MKNKFSGNKGITLIALVITILVMLILAGVSISMIIREDGVISQAEESKKRMEIAEITEKANLIASGLITQKKAYQNPSLANVVTFRDALLEEFNVEGVDTNEDTIIDVSDKYAIIIKNTKLEVEVVEKKSPYYLTIDEAQNIWETDGKGTIKKYKGIDSNVIVPIRIGEEYIKYIDCNSFEKKSSLIDIKICGNIKNIYTEAFKECVNLNNVIIYDGLNSFGIKVFSGCNKLESIILPNSLISIVDFVSNENGGVFWSTNLFEGCNSLETIYLEAGEFKEQEYDDKGEPIPHKFEAIINNPSVYGIPNGVTIIDLRK